MTEPVTPWAEYHRNEWADLVDPLRPPTTDEEPWQPPLEFGPDLPVHRDARLLLLAFAGMALIGVIAWAVQR